MKNSLRYAILTLEDLEDADIRLLINILIAFSIALAVFIFVGIPLIMVRRIMLVRREEARALAYAERIGESYKVELLSVGYGRYTNIIIYSVNGETPIIAGDTLYVPSGECRIEAGYLANDSNGRGRTVMDGSQHDRHVARKMNFFTRLDSMLASSPSRGVTLNADDRYIIEFKPERGWSYELKADSYAGEMELYALRGDEHKEFVFRKQIQKPKSIFDGDTD